MQNVVQCAANEQNFRTTICRRDHKQWRDHKKEILDSLFCRSTRNPTRTLCKRKKKNSEVWETIDEAIVALEVNGALGQHPQYYYLRWIFSAFSYRGEQFNQNFIKAGAYNGSCKCLQYI